MGEGFEKNSRLNLIGHFATFHTSATGVDLVFFDQSISGVFDGICGITGGI
jgi:hypothetical protein